MSKNVKNHTAMRETSTENWTLAQQDKPSPSQQDALPAMAHERTHHRYFEVPDDIPAGWLKYNATRRLYAVCETLGLPPVTIRWFIDGGDTLAELMHNGYMVADFWGCTYEEALHQRLHAGKATDFSETGNRWGFANREMPDTIWVRAEAWKYPRSVATRTAERPYTLGEVVTHECRHLWQYRHFDAATLDNDDALEHDAYSYQRYFEVLRHMSYLPPFQFLPLVAHAESGVAS